MKNQCTSVAGLFDGHADVLVQCCSYCPMQHVQGYTGSLWTPPSGNYSLRIFLASKGNSKQINNEKMHQLFWPF
jgi:hypothetical protein